MYISGMFRRAVALSLEQVVILTGTAPDLAGLDRGDCGHGVDTTKG